MKPKDMLEQEDREVASSDQAVGSQPEEIPGKRAESYEDQVSAEVELEGPEGEDKPDLDTVIAERDRVRAEKAELLEKFQRAQAEFENARKQLVREKQEAHEYAAMEVIRSLLPIVDDFERARSTPDLDPEFRKGLDLIHERILEVFTRAGLKPVNEEGKFDPHFHHAVDKAPAESDEHDQRILEVYQRGYQFKDRLLRPAMVKVAVKE